MRTRIAWLSLALAACGGGGPGEAREGGGGATAGSEACPRAEVSLGGTCWSASGTRWRIQADGPGGDYRFEVTLLAAGRARSTDHAEASPAEDEWFQDEGLLRIFLSDRFVEYRTTVTNGTVLIGEAINVRGQRWSWRGDRLFGDPPCEGTDARTEQGCLTVAGTRWDLHAEGQPARVIEFLDEARLASEGREGRWEQAGTALTFTLEDGGPEFIALISDSSELSGRYASEASEGAGSREGIFRASRLESIPPVMHE